MGHTGLWLRGAAWVEVLGVCTINYEMVKGNSRCPEKVETRVRENTQEKAEGPPTLGCLPPSPTMSSALRPPTQDHSPSLLGPRHLVLLALTFKVPFVFPPTFTLILLPKENLQEQKRERDVRKT